MAYFINKEDCVGCGYCKFVCAFGAIEEKRENNRDYFEITDKCVGCGQCFKECLVACIFPKAGHRGIKKVTVDKEKCIGCSLCKKKCPAFAVDGVLKQPFVINQSLCIKCGICAANCKKDAIIVDYE